MAIACSPAAVLTVTENFTSPSNALTEAVGSPSWMGAVTKLVGARSSA